MELREDYIFMNQCPYCVDPPNITDFSLFSTKIKTVCNDSYILELSYCSDDLLELI